MTLIVEAAIYASIVQSTIMVQALYTLASSSRRSQRTSGILDKPIATTNKIVDAYDLTITLLVCAVFVA